MLTVVTANDAARAQRIPGVRFVRTIRSVNEHGPFNHNHAIMAGTRRFAAEETTGALLRKDSRGPAMRSAHPGPESVRTLYIGASNREMAGVDPANTHYCGSNHSGHDYINCNHSDHDWEACTWACYRIRTTDFVYYTSPGRIYALLVQHGAHELVADILNPFVGGCGTRGAGEAHWERVRETDQIAMTTDSLTLENYHHSDMTWITSTDGVRVPGGRTLSWVPLIQGGGRMTVRFFVTDLEPKVAPRAFTLRRYLEGLIPWKESNGEDALCYSSQQVARLLDAGNCADGMLHHSVDLSHVGQIVRTIQGSPNEAGKELALAKRKARILGCEDIPTTAALAVRISEMQSDQARYMGDVWWYPSWRTRRWVTMVRRRFTAASQSTVYASHQCAGFLALMSQQWECGKSTTVYSTAFVPVLCSAMPAGKYALNVRGPSGEPVEQAVLRVDDNVCTRCTASGCPSSPYTHAGLSMVGAPNSVCCPCAGNLARAIHTRCVVPLQDRDTAAIGIAVAGITPHLRHLFLLPPQTAYLSQEPRYSHYIKSFSHTKQAAMERGATLGVEDSPVRASLKIEVVTKFQEDVTDDPKVGKPRQILPCDPVISAHVGPAVHGVSAVFKQVCNAESEVMFMSGMDGDQVGMYVSQHIDYLTGMGEVFSGINSDISACDGGNTFNETGRIAHAAYLLLGMDPHALNELMLSQCTSSIVGGKTARDAGSGFSYKTANPQNMSGFDDTTLRNSAVLALLHHVTMRLVEVDHNLDPTAVAWSAALEYPADWTVDNPVPPRRSSHDNLSMAYQSLGGLGAVTTQPEPRQTGLFRCVVMGDDSLVVLPKRLRASYLHWFDKVCESVGWAAECTAVDEIHNLEICSGVFYPVPGGLCLGPKLGRQVARGGLLRTHQVKDADALMRGNVEGLRVGMSHVPLFRELYDCVNRNTRDRPRCRSQTLQTVDRRNLSKVMRHPSEEAEEFMCARYGLTMKDLREMGHELNSVSRFPARVGHSGWLRMLRIDLA